MTKPTEPTKHMTSMGPVSKTKKSKDAAATHTHRFDLGGGAVGFCESSTAVPLVSIVLSLRSGAVADPEGKDGLFRVMTRMLRRGAAGMTASQIDNAIDTLGGELGLDVGPSTMSFHAQVIRRNLKPFCELLAKILGQPTFDGEELARLKRESVAALIEARDSDRALASLAFRRAVFPGHPYARSAAGKIATIEALTREDVVATYKKHFVRSELVVGFAGAISESEAKELGALFAKTLPEGPKPALVIPDPPAMSGRRLVFIDKPERTQTQILIGTLGTWPKDEDHFPLVTATAVFGGTFTSRMMREIRSKRGWSYGTSARLSIERKRHAFVMSAAPAANDCAPCLGLEIRLLEELVNDGIRPRELAFIKNYLVRSHAFEVDTAPKRLGEALENELLELPADYHSGYLDHVRAVTLDGANQALKNRLSPANLAVIVVGTASEILDRVVAAIPDLTHHEVVPFDRD